MLTSHIVTSSDGVKFSVQFESRTEAAANIAKNVETNWASRRTAAQLTAHGDFHRVDTRQVGALPELDAEYVQPGTLPAKAYGGLRLVGGSQS